MFLFNLILENFFIITIFLPLVAALTLFFFDDFDWYKLRFISLGFSFIIFLFSLVLFYFFNPSINSFQFEIFYQWLPTLFLSYHVALDGVSIFLFILTAFLIPLCILVSWNSIKYRARDFFVLLFFIEFLLFNVFSVLDLFLFYLFFEGVLIPMFLIIGIWGSRLRRVHAAYQFFLYTLIGSLFMLLGLIYIYLIVGSLDFNDLKVFNFSNFSQVILFLCFFASLATKIPMMPVHIWLPEAHVEAPTAGSVLLAGILLKLGGYGFIRFVLPLLPYASLYFKPFIFLLSVVAIIYSSFTTIRQIDLKKIIAYSSVAHMNFVTIGIFSLTYQGLNGSILLMLSHGLISSGLFICIGFIYDRYGTRLVPQFGGLVSFMPIFAIIFMVLTMSNMSLPGTAGFIGELLVIAGIFSANTLVAFLASIGIILGAVYSVWLYNRVCFGLEGFVLEQGFADLNFREFFIFISLVFLILLMGINPNFFLETIQSASLVLLINS
jgi:NADH-quinone oxidoreductase subunit M